MDNNLKRGPKPPRGRRGSVAMARRAQRLAGIKGINVHDTIGVQGQVFTIVNSDEEQYEYQNLIDGAWVDETHWADVAKYTGSKVCNSVSSHL